jgi:outer membrane lipoprotein-sorting protein
MVSFYPHLAAYRGRPSALKSPGPLATSGQPDRGGELVFAAVGWRLLPRPGLLLLLALHVGLGCRCLPDLSAEEPDTVLHHWFAAQTNVQTWAADFVQTRFLPALTEPLTATGKVWVAIPNRFRWELNQPAQTIVIRKPEQLIVIYPRLKRAEKYPLGSSQAGPWKDASLLLEAGFPRNQAELERQFNVISATTTNSNWLVLLQPKAASARRFMSEIEIGLARKDFSLVSTTVKFRDGTRLRNEFLQATNNPTLPADWLEERLGADYVISEPAGK